MRSLRSAKPYLRYVAYGVVLAGLAFLLEWIEFRYVTRAFSAEIVLVLIAAAFLALGVWAGAQLTGSRRAPNAPFERNDAALGALGVTPREYAVLELLAAGQSNKEIARSLGVSPNTVKTHLARLFEKLEVERRTQAVARARDLRLIA